MGECAPSCGSGLTDFVSSWGVCKCVCVCVSGSLDTHLPVYLLATSLSAAVLNRHLALCLCSVCVYVNVCVCACTSVCACVWPRCQSVVSSWLALPLSLRVTPIHKFFCSFKKQNIIFSRLSARHAKCIITFVIRKTH